MMGKVHASFFGGGPQVTLNNNVATVGSGGAIQVDSIYNPTFMVDSFFTNNSALGGGGAIYASNVADNATINIHHCHFSVRWAALNMTSALGISELLSLTQFCWSGTINGVQLLLRDLHFRQHLYPAAT
jgi:predicted outer membrane repeat protein